MGIYRAYDIRGKFPDELNQEIAYKIAQAYAVFLGRKKIVVGRDARISSPLIHKSVVNGLLKQGINVIDIGLCTTPMFYFAIHNYKYGGGIMITASHLGKQFNGIKLCREKAIPITYESGIKHIEMLVKNNNFYQIPPGKLIKKNILKSYENFVLRGIKKTNLKIVVDAGNMMGSIDGRIIAKRAKVIPMFFKINPEFPNRDIDTSKEDNIIKLKYKVIKEKADLGIAFDGDADRAAFIDNKGRTIKPSVVASLFMEYMIKKNSAIIYELTLSKIINETAKKMKIKPIMSRVGHSYIGTEMRKNNAVFGVENSGHYYFKNNSYMDSALLCTLNFMQILNNEKKSASELVSTIHVYPSEIIILKTKSQNSIINDIEKLFAKNSKKIIKIDGISIYCDEYWLNARKSNTEDKIKIFIEADTNKKLEEVKKKIKYLLYKN